MNLALVLDPLYAFTYLRKCEVLEAVGENCLCVQYAESALNRLFPSDEDDFQFRNCDSVKEALKNYTQLEMTEKVGSGYSYNSLLGKHDQGEVDAIVE